MIERKSVLAEFKARKTPGEFEALFSVFGNIDHDGDRIHKGAFKSAFENDPNPAVVWTHRWDVPPIGETVEAVETDKGAKGVARLFLDDHEVARQVWKGLASGALKQFSFAYTVSNESFSEPGDGESARRYDGKIREIHEFGDVFEWGPTLVGANSETGLLAGGKALDTLLGMKDLGLDVLLAAAKKDADGEGDDEGEAKDESGDDTTDRPDPAAVAMLLAERPMDGVTSAA